MINRDLNHLDIIEEMIERVQTRLMGVTLSAFMSDRDVQDLTAYRLAIMGEAANKLSLALKDRHADVNWARCTGCETSSSMTIQASTWRVYSKRQQPSSMY